MDRKTLDELSRLDPSIPFRYSTNHLHHTWARTFYSRPELYLQPQSIPEIQKIVTLARRCRKRLVVVGYGHSPSDLTCTSSWMVNLDNFNKVLEYDVDGTPGLIRFQAGLSLHDLNVALSKKGFTMPNLGSIDVQSVAGAISTGTHGSSLQHGLLSNSITSITLVLSNGQPVRCSATNNTPLFRAALLSLGSLGIIAELTFQAVPDFNIRWQQNLVPLSDVLSSWSNTLWTSAEYTRVWWLPYLNRAVIWRANRTTFPPKPPQSTFYGGKLGYYIYHNLLYLSNYVPRLLPWVEWFVFGMQYGFSPYKTTATAIEPARQGLLMDCLYSQFVNEWALPLSKGPEALTRLSDWINQASPESHRIPFANRGVYVHCPIEVRVSNTFSSPNASGARPLLDPTVSDGPTLYLNATLYRPYGLDPPCRDRYYEAFEWLMRDLGARPHWAKNFAYTDVQNLRNMYGADYTTFLQLRDEVDPDGMFIGPWHRRNLGATVDVGAQSCVETETKREKFGAKNGGWGDGMFWTGGQRLTDDDDGVLVQQDLVGKDDELDGKGRGGGSIQRRKLKLDVAARREAGAEAGAGVTKGTRVDGDDTSSSLSISPPATTTSEESFDYMAKGEASIVYQDPTNIPAQEPETKDVA